MREVVAINKDHSQAYYYLGFLFERGYGVDLDLNTAE